MSAALESVDTLEVIDDVRLNDPVEWHRPATKSGRRALAAVIVANIFAAVWYLTWLLQPSRVGNPYLYGILVLAEAFNITQACGFWWTVAGHRHHHVDPEYPALPTSTTVDVFIPTYSESVEVVEPTIMRAMQLTGADVSVWLLDDGDRPAMEQLAARYGAGYITRDEHSGAKAGNINHALTCTQGDYILVLDCDHVPLTHFLEATLPQFHDEKVAFVQTPQYYANFDQSPIAAGSWSQQAIFFGAILEGKNRHDATFCCGTNVVFRRTALESVGGFPTNSLTEDFELSVRMHEAKWKTRYVSETLASGLGPEDMASYVSQQHRWARGCLSALPRVLKAKLPMRLRLQYLLSSVYFFSGFTVLAYMSLPVLNLVFHVQPLSAITSDQFLVHFAPYYGLCLYSLARAGRGSFKFSAFSLSSASFWIQIHACYRWIFRRPSRFVVTPKEGSDNRQPRAVMPALVVTLILLGSAAYGLTRHITPGVLNNVAFAMMHFSVLVAGLWPALVVGQGKIKAVNESAEVADVVELPEVAIVPQWALVENTDVI
jgi:cellulose synthase (UDP-forming)